MSALTTRVGQRIFYDYTGMGIPVLFVSGMLGNRRGLEARLATRWRVITMYLRDSGESDPEPATGLGKPCLGPKPQHEPRELGWSCLAPRTNGREAGGVPVGGDPAGGGHGGEIDAHDGFSRC
jgi:pimeloyl-ACP methyl ester carboxylesterase